MKTITQALLISGWFLCTLGRCYAASWANDNSVANLGNIVSTPTSAWHVYMGIQGGVVNSQTNTVGVLPCHVPPCDKQLRDIKIQTGGQNIGALGILVLGVLWDVGGEEGSGPLVLGLEAQVAGNSGHVNITNKGNVLRVDDGGVQEKISYHYGINALIGTRALLPHNDALVYVKLGWVSGLITSHAVSSKLQMRIPSGYPGDFHYWDNGINLGVGVMGSINTHWGWQIEGDYIYYQSFSKSIDYQYQDDTILYTNTTWTYKPRQMSIIVGVMYQFSV